MEPESDPEQKLKAKPAHKTSSQTKSPRNRNLPTHLPTALTECGPDLVQSSADSKVMKHSGQNRDKPETNLNPSNSARKNHRDRGRRKGEQKLKKKDSTGEEVCDRNGEESFGKDCDKSTIKSTMSQADIDPLSLDLYEKLLTENSMEKDKNSNGDDNLDQEKSSDDDLSIDLYDKLCSNDRNEAKRKREKSCDEDDTNKRNDNTDSQSQSIDHMNMFSEDKESRTEKNCDDDNEEDDATDPLSEDLFDKLCRDKEKEKKRGKHCKAKRDVVDGDCDDEESGEREGDPLSRDMFDKLCEESGVEAPDVLQWNKCLVGEDLQKVCKKLSCSEKQFYTTLMCIFVAVTLAMVFGLFVLQAQMSFNSKEMVGRVPMGKSKKVMPQGMYTLYYDFFDSGVLPENVDLRANTTIFVH